MATGYVVFAPSNGIMSRGAQPNPQAIGRPGIVSQPTLPAVLRQAIRQQLARNQLVKSFASAALNGGDGVTILTLAA
jgi:hypothetical protein